MAIYEKFVIENNTMFKIHEFCKILEEFVSVDKVSYKYYVSFTTRVMLIYIFEFLRIFSDLCCKSHKT